jgi:hypothetical protein
METFYDATSKHSQVPEENIKQKKPRKTTNVHFKLLRIERRISAALRIAKEHFCRLHVSDLPAFSDQKQNLQSH